MFLGATLLASGMYSNQIFAFEENGNAHDQNGNLNEAEINADIEQENKCKKDTECENENEINNLLNITTITTAAGAANGNGNGNGDGNGDQCDPLTCTLCFGLENECGVFQQQQLTLFLNYIDTNPIQYEGGSVQLSTIQQICDYLESQPDGTVPFDPIALAVENAIPGNQGGPGGLIAQLFDCLESSGIVFEEA